MPRSCAVTKCSLPVPWRCQRLRLARVLAARGAFTEAEPLRRRILEARERQLGPEHRDTLACVNNLAFVLRQLGKFSEALRRCSAAAESLEWLVPRFLVGTCE